ncbi:hypothetical protein J6590_005461 [Homalodisca vitripennis]|nr:hypothetical protein J6590_005461 [Homalodisca vitripennis]
MCEPDDSYTMDDSCNEEIFASAFPARERTPVGGSCPPAGGPSRARARSSSPYGGSCPPGMAPPRARSPVAGPSGLCPIISTPRGRPAEDLPYPCRRLDDGNESSECEDLNLSIGTWSTGNESAFDVVDHGLLLRNLENLGIRGKAFDWIASYLLNRRQIVEIRFIDDTGCLRKQFSEEREVRTGVPQGSASLHLSKGVALYQNDTGSNPWRNKI